MKNIQQFFPLILIFTLLSCGSVNGNQEEDFKEDGKNTIGKSYLISARIVEKQRIINSEIQAKTDYFLERSVQDYFIKFCESNVSRSELEAYLAKQRASIKILHAEVEYLEGEWDTCDSTGINDSRFGSYVIIKRLLD